MLTDATTKALRGSEQRDNAHQELVTYCTLEQCGLLGCMQKVILYTTYTLGGTPN